MRIFSIMATGPGLPTRFLSYVGDCINLDCGPNTVFFSESMVDRFLAIWRAKANCSHLTFTKLEKREC